MNPAAEAVVTIPGEGKQNRSPLHRTLGPAFTFREINFLRWTIFIAAAAVSAWKVLYLYFQSGGFLRNFEGDFVYSYAFGRILNQYPATRLYDYALQRKICDELHPLKTLAYGPYPYPPFVAVLFQPFAHLSFMTAYVLWLAISLGLYTAGLSLIARRFFPGNPSRRALIFCFALCFAPFLTWIMQSGQISTIGFFAMALAFCMEDLDRPVLSGLALSLCLYKPTLLLLFVPMLVITRRFKVLAGLASGGVALILFPIALHGIAVWEGYIHMLLSFGSQVASTVPFRVPWIYVDLGAFASLIPGGHSWPGRVALAGFCGWAAFSLLRIWWRFADAGKPVRTLIWATTLAWTLVLNAYVPLYDSILVIVAIVATAGALNGIADQSLHRRLTLAWLLIFAFSWVTQDLAEHTGFQIMTLLLVALGILQLSALRRMKPLSPKGIGDPGLVNNWSQ